MRKWKPQLATLIVAILLVAATVLVTLAVARPKPAAPVAACDHTLRVAVIGDSYSAGLHNGIVWPSLVAGSSKLSISNVALPGSGYVGGIGETPPFAGQADKALASKPDIIIVFGGLNDVGLSTDLITSAATGLFTNLITRAPGAKLIVFGPIWHDDPAPPSALEIDSAVAAAANAAHATYVRLIDEKWLVGEGLIQDDGIDPTDQGQTTLARELGPLIQRQIRQQGQG
jgi:lysophospholipase L1-like esterase